MRCLHTPQQLLATVCTPRGAPGRAWLKVGSNVHRSRCPNPRPITRGSSSSPVYFSAAPSQVFESCGEPHVKPLFLLPPHLAPARAPHPPTAPSLLSIRAHVCPKPHLHPNSGLLTAPAHPLRYFGTSHPKPRYHPLHIPSSWGHAQCWPSGSPCSTAPKGPSCLWLPFSPQIKARDSQPSPFKARKSLEVGPGTAGLYLQPCPAPHPTQPVQESP